MPIYRVAATSDHHAPITDRRLFEAALSLIADFKPDVYVMAGDWLEGKRASRHSPDARHNWSPVDEMREVARHERRSGFALDYTDDPAAKREFFHRLYEPYVAQRFGEGAVRVSEAFFLHRARDQELARLRCNGEWIAGVLP